MEKSESLPGAFRELVRLPGTLHSVTLLVRH
nr:MAG TPA: hypothetical protein [Caudoviricetes sp.]